MGDQDRNAELPSNKRKAQFDNSVETNKRTRYEDVLSNLALQVTNIQNFLSSRFPSTENPPSPSETVEIHGDDGIDLNVSGELFSDLESGPRNREEINGVAKTPEQPFSMTLETIAKEPSVPKSAPNHLASIKQFQRFESSDWAEIRYSEVQKNYVSTPGFVELQSNEEIQPYDVFNNLSHTERGFAAISSGLLKQRDAMEQGIRSFMSWIGSAEVVDTLTIQNKINDIFLEGDYKKISSDLLQMACGHRADLVQQRRDSILRSVKDKFIKETLRKIPPSCDSLFQADTFSTTLEKKGGASKVFWPSKSESRFNKKVTQTISNPGAKSRYFLPAQGNQLTFSTPAQPALNNYFYPPNAGTAQVPYYHTVPVPPGPPIPTAQVGYGYEQPLTRPPAQGNRNFRSQRSSRGHKSGFVSASTRPSYNDSRKDSRGKKRF